MSARFVWALVASIAGLSVSLLLPARGHFGAVYGSDHEWRAPRTVAVYLYHRDRDEDDDWDDVREEGDDRCIYNSAPEEPEYGNVSVVVPGGQVGYGRHGYDRPPGWNHGRKRGWGACDLPPGQAKKYGCGGNFVVGFSYGR